MSSDRGGHRGRAFLSKVQSFEIVGCGNSAVAGELSRRTPVPAQRVRRTNMKKQLFVIEVMAAVGVLLLCPGTATAQMLQACCFPDHSCVMLEPLECRAQ